MEKVFEQIDQSNGRFRIKLQSNAELAEYKKVFLDPVPSTRKMVHRYEGMELIVESVIDEAALARVQKQAKALMPDGVEVGSVEYVKALEAKSKPELITIAAQLGVQLTESQSKAQMASQIIERQSTQKQDAAKQ